MFSGAMLDQTKFSKWIRSNPLDKGTVIALCSILGFAYLISCRTSKLLPLGGGNTDLKIDERNSFMAEMPFELYHFFVILVHLSR